MTLDPMVLDFIVHKMKIAYQPSAIYLYGSRVWGEASEQSDIDLFIVLKSSQLEMDDRIRIGTRAMSGSGLDIDILVMTEAEIFARKAHPSTLTHKILSQGVKIFEAA